MSFKVLTVNFFIPFLLSQYNLLSKSDYRNCKKFLYRINFSGKAKRYTTKRDKKLYYSTYLKIFILVFLLIQIKICSLFTINHQYN